MNYMLDNFIQWWLMLEEHLHLSLWCSIHRNRPGWCWEEHRKPRAMPVLTIVGTIEDISIEGTS